MRLTPQQLARAESELFARIRAEFEQANDENKIEDCFATYNYIYENEEPMLIQTRTHSVLVLGALGGRKSDYEMAAKKMGIDPEHVIFENDYSRLGRFDTRSLEYSSVYSDIILGPVPHSQEGIGDNSSLRAAILNSPSKYPRLLVNEDSSHRLKTISISDFRKHLNNTRYASELRK